MSIILLSIAVLGGIGLLIGVFLGFFAMKFEVPVDEKELQVLDALPGNNCGACGYPGCSGLATAIAKGNAPCDACPVGGATVAKAVATIMGEQVNDVIKKVAYVRCAGDCDKTKTDYAYTGIKTCVAMSFVPNGGPKSCNYGCLGYGDCVNVCDFDAIHIVNGIAIIDKDKCTSCGKCVKACPKQLIELIPYEAEYVVACRSKDKGVDTTKGCEVGCISCTLCKKACESGAITIENFLAYIDQDKCIQCGKCYNVCPKNTIQKL